MRRPFAAVLLVLLLGPVVPAHAGRGALFDRTVQVLRTRYHDPAFRESRIPALADSLRPLARAARSDAEERAVVWALLTQVPATHSALISRRTHRRWFTELRGESAPTLGLDLVVIGGRHYATNLLEGGPARAAGIEPWQEITAIDGRPVAASRRLDWRSDDAYLPDDLDPPIHALMARDGERVRLTVAGREVTVTARRWSGREAARASARVTVVDGRRVGVLHLWYVHLQGVPELMRESFAGPLREAEALVLDLRGRGGSAMMVPRIVAELDGPKASWRGPVVALLDRQSRSAKDVLAHELKQSGRARLVGENSAGAVIPASFENVGGGAVLMFPTMKLPTYTDLLELRGGVAPDVRVARGGPDTPGQDPILAAGLVEAARLAGTWTAPAAAAAAVPEVAMPADARLPGAAELRERLASAYGPRPTTGMTHKGRMEVPGTPYAGPFTAVYLPDQRFHMAIDIGLMKITEGYDGSSAWVRDPGGERRALERDLFVAGLFTRALRGELPFDAHVKALEPDSLERFDDVPCVRAAARDAAGKRWTLWFELATGRLRGSRTDVKTQHGAARVTTTYRDYRTFDGFAVPTDVLSDMGFQQQRLRIETVEFVVPSDTNFAGK